VSQGDLVREGTVLARITGAHREAERAGGRCAGRRARIEEREQERNEGTMSTAPGGRVARSQRAEPGRPGLALLSGEGRVLAHLGSLYRLTVAPGDSLLLVGRLDSLRVRFLSASDAGRRWRSGAA
jgi:hypothetical protein